MRLFPLSRFEVQGNSMLPNLEPGTEVISFNWAYLFAKPKAGDFVVAQVKGREVIKRISKIKGDEVFLKGDNENESTDSRDFGWIKKEQIMGKVIYVL